MDEFILEGFLLFWPLFSVVAIIHIQPFTKELLKVNENILLFIISGILTIGFYLCTIISTHCLDMRE